MGNQEKKNLLKRTRKTLQKTKGIGRIVGDKILEQTKKVADLISDKAKDIEKKSPDIVKDLKERFSSKTKEFYYGILGKEDYIEIFRKNRIVLDILEKRRLYEENPIYFQKLFNIRWKSSVLLGLATSGTFTFDDTVTDVSSKLMHGVMSHQELSKLLLGKDFADLHKTIDTVPGKEIAGGFGHRLEYGHDLDSLSDVYEEEGLPGIFAWALHGGQDFFTSHGIPIFPDGGLSKEILEEHTDLNPAKILDVTCLNFAELLSGILTIFLILRLYRLGMDIKRNIRIKNLCIQAADLLDRDDMEGAIKLYEDALSISNNDPRIHISLGYTFLRNNYRIRAFECFREAAKNLAEDIPIDTGGGAEISLRGLSYLMSLTTCDSIIEKKHLQTKWFEYLQDLTTSTMVAFEKMGMEQEDRRIIKRLSGESWLPPRYFSSSLNYYLAAKTAASSPVLERRNEKITKYLGKASNQLEKAKGVVSKEEASNILDFIKKFWEIELLPIK